MDQFTNQQSIYIEIATSQSVSPRMQSVLAETWPRVWLSDFELSANLVGNFQVRSLPFTTGQVHSKRKLSFQTSRQLGI